VTIRLSLGLPIWAATDPGGWTAVFDAARAADATGVDRVLVSDHVVFGERLDEYGRPEVGGTAGGRQPTGPDGHWLEPLTTLSVVAGMTSRVRLGTSILLAALRRPVVLAKTASTLDVLSGGRLDLGVGVGWQRAEYEAAGLDFADRGRLLDHTLDVCRTLWREPRASYASERLTFDAIHQMPKPLQPGGVPIWVSGTLNRAVVRRIARFGSGWIPWGPDATDPSAATRMRELVAAEGRAADDIGVSVPLPAVRDGSGALLVDATMERVGRLAAAGVTDVRLSLALPPGQAAAEDALAPIVAAVRAF
jgi:probable F420-dependent oxidoreductase